MESEQNKSEQATPYKLQKAREKGQVSKSQEFSAVLSLAVFLTLIFATHEQFFSNITLLSTQLFTIAGNVSSHSILLQDVLADFFLKTLQLLAPILITLVLIALLSNILQVGFVFTLFPFKPNFSKMNPASNIKKIFSKRTVFELFKVSFKIICFALVLVFMSDYLIGSLRGIVFTPYAQLSDVWISLFFQLALVLLLVLAGIAFLDFMFNKQDFSQKMKMSTREVKEEHKNREGDPEVKAKRKQNQKELLEKTASLSNVQTADLIVTNPVHIAVALKFDRLTMMSPQIVALGRGELAEHIRYQARVHRVPIIKNVKLARLLYKQLKLNQFIPTDLFKDVAPVYQWLYKMQGKPIHE